MNKLCLTCRKEFYVYKSEIRKGNGKYCSVACYRKSQFGRIFTTERCAKIAKSKIGKKIPEEVREKISKTLIRMYLGEKRIRWLGDKAGYKSLHVWVTRHLGRPDTCEHCGKSGLSNRRIHWANKSHKYLRDLTDWLRLCVPCHRKYDAFPRTHLPIHNLRGNFLQN